MKKIVLFSLIVSGLFAANCAMCHNGSYQVKLDRFSPEQITQIMMDFKNGKKAGMTMPGIAKSMSDEEIKKVAKEYGTK
jgi:cytochrome c553